MAKIHVLLASAALVAPVLAASAFGARGAEPVMVQCGREYQAARSAGTLNGQDWNAYRGACAERLKAAPAAAAAAPAGAPPAPGVAASVPAKEAAPTAGAAPAPATSQSAGMAAMHARQKQCGAEWTSQKATLVSQTPGLTWPKYWSLCNTRLKTTGR